TNGNPGELDWSLVGPVAPAAGGTCVDLHWTGAPVVASGVLAVTADGNLTTGPASLAGPGCYSWADIFTGNAFVAATSVGAGADNEVVVVETSSTPSSPPTTNTPPTTAPTGPPPTRAPSPTTASSRATSTTSFTTTSAPTMSHQRVMAKARFLVTTTSLPPVPVAPTTAGPTLEKLRQATALAARPARVAAAAAAAAAAASSAAARATAARVATEVAVAASTATRPSNAAGAATHKGNAAAAVSRAPRGTRAGGTFPDGLGLIGTDLGHWSPSAPPWGIILSGTIALAFLAICGAGFARSHRRRRRV
ncbi:MAG: hypothetical protein ABSA91_19455, partial [Acidimicrobiales bacterium]